MCYRARVGGSVVDYLNHVPLAALMLVVTLGYLLGRLSWRGIVVGPAGGTVVVGLLLGHWGLTLDALYGDPAPEVTIGLFGFSLFIYSIGFEAGPGFFSALRSSTGWRFLLVGTLVNVLAVAFVVALARLLDLDSSTIAGVLAGSLTSAPTYAAASEVAPDPTRLSVTFALAYPVGLIGLVLIMQTVPRWWGSPLPGEDDRESAMPASLVPEHGTPEVTRCFRVQAEEAKNRTLRELNLTHRTGCVLSAIRRESEIFIPRADSRLHSGDHVRATGRVDELQDLEELIGPEVYDSKLTDLPLRRVQVVNHAAVGRMLQELDLPGRFGVIVTRIESRDLLIEPTPYAVLNAGDIVDLAGSKKGVQAATRELGRREPPSTHTDIAVYAGGIVLGLLLGNLHWDALGWDFSLGLAGGLLLSGVLLSHLRQIGPFSANVPRAARQLVRDLGILLFVGEAALDAGAHVASVVDYPWKTLLLISIATTAVPVLATAWLGRVLLRMRPVDNWGSVCGGMTSSAALVVIRRTFGSNEPAVGYAAAYAIASVLATLAGQVVVAFA